MSNSDDTPTTNVTNTVGSSQISTDTIQEYSDFYLEIMVSDPQKQRDEHGSFINYQVSTKTDKTSYHDIYKANMPANKSAAPIGRSDILVVHRRYSDFLLLHNILVNDYPCSIIPPIPDKKVLQYFAGDRFSPSFTQKRCHSLQNFLQKLSLHPIYKNSKILETFLVSGTEWEIYRKTININNFDNSTSGKDLAGGSNNNKEDVSDYFINAFRHVHNQSDEFVEIKEKSEKLDYNINKIDKVTHKVVKLQDSLIEDYGKLSNGLENFKDLLRKTEFLNNNTNSATDDSNNKAPHNVINNASSNSSVNVAQSNDNFNDVKEAFKIDVDHTKLIDNLSMLVDGFVSTQYAFKDLTKYYDFEYISDLKDMEHYIDNLKHLVKIKDQKQIDYEELNDYLTKSINEKNNLISGYSGNFFTNKFEEIAGINQEQSRREKISKLDAKIETLTEEVANAKKISVDFEKQTLREVEIFENVKTQSLKKSLTDLADNQIQFYESLYQTWSKVEDGL